MNERIRELAEQCYYEDTECSTWSLNNRHFDYNKFAELIVNECMNHMIATDFNDVNGSHNAAIQAAADELMEHFGIGE